MPPPATVRRVLGRTAAEYTALVGSSYTVAEAARVLGVDESRVRHRLAASTLYGFKHAGNWRLPRLQFEDGRLVRGIERVFPHVPPGLHPLAIARWFTTPDVELTLNDAPQGPRNWLLAGGPPEVVAPLATGLGLSG